MSERAMTVDQSQAATIVFRPCYGDDSPLLAYKDALSRFEWVPDASLGFEQSEIELFDQGCYTRYTLVVHAIGYQEGVAGGHILVCLPLVKGHARRAFLADGREFDTTPGRWYAEGDPALAIACQINAEHFGATA